MVQKEESLKKELGEVEEEMMGQEEDTEEEPIEKIEIEGEGYLKEEQGKEMMGKEQGAEKEQNEKRKIKREGKLKEEKGKEIEKKGNETQMKTKEMAMVGKENVKKIKDAESLAEMIGAELKGLLETIIQESGKEPLKKVLENFTEDLRPTTSLALEYFM